MTLFFEKWPKILLFAFFPFLATAYFSQGFLHPDEHYQILEIVNLKLNKAYTDLSIFNWDYHLKIRSMVQPFLYTIILFPVQKLSPFFLAFIIRLFNSLLAFYSFYLFFKIDEPNHDKIKKNLLATSIIWFIPLLMARTNAESLSTSLFLIGYYHYQNKKRFNFGMLFFAFSYLVRFQMALLIAPIILFDFFKKRTSFFDNLKMFIVLSLTFAFGILIDYFMYDGKWVLSSYNYFYQNIILKKANDFGVDPFYYYFYKPLIKGVPIISIPILIWGLKSIKESFNKYQSLYVGLFLFTLLHSVISHKEVRFLTFTYVLLTLIFVKNYREELFKNYRQLSLLFIFLNLIIMLKTSFTSAHSRINLYQAVNDFQIDKITHLDFGTQTFEFSMPFYTRRKIDVFLTSDLKFLNKKRNQLQYILTTSENFNSKLEEKECQVIYQSHPKFIKSFNFFNWQKRFSKDKIWRCPSD